MALPGANTAQPRTIGSGIASATTATLALEPIGGLMLGSWAYVIEDGAYYNLEPSDEPLGPGVVEVFGVAGLRWILNAAAGGVASVTGDAPISTAGTSTVTVSHDESGVDAGSYTNANITVDEFGHVTAAENGDPGGVTDVTASAPLASSGGATPNITHQNSGVSANTYTNASVTVNATGHVTAASSGTAPVTNVTGTSPIASSGGATPAISLNDTAVTPGSYTSANITVDQKGRITAASNGSAGGAAPGYVVQALDLLPGSSAIPQANVVQGSNFPIESMGFAINDIATSPKFPLTGYTGGDITVKVVWYAAATSDAVKWQVQLGAPTTSQSLETKSLATATSTQTTVNSNAKAKNTTTITITGASLDGAAANDLIVLQFKRIAASADMTGDALFVYASVSWA